MLLNIKLLFSDSSLPDLPDLDNVSRAENSTSPVHVVRHKFKLSMILIAY